MPTTLQSNPRKPTSNNSPPRLLQKRLLSAWARQSAESAVQSPARWLAEPGVHTYIHMYIYRGIYIYMYVCICVCMCIYIYIHTHPSTCIVSKCDTSHCLGTLVNPSIQSNQPTLNSSGTPLQQEQLLQAWPQPSLGSPMQSPVKGLAEPGHSLSHRKAPKHRTGPHQDMMHALLLPDGHPSQQPNQPTRPSLAARAAVASVGSTIAGVGAAISGEGTGTTWPFMESHGKVHSTTAGHDAFTNVGTKAIPRNNPTSQPGPRLQQKRLLHVRAPLSVGSVPQSPVRGPAAPGQA